MYHTVKPVLNCTLNKPESCRVRVMVFDATFNNISVIMYTWHQFYWWRKLEYKEKTTDLSQVTDKIITSLAGFELTMFVVMGTDCTGSCKSNYHTIMMASESCINQTFNKVPMYEIFVNLYCINWTPVCFKHKSWFQGGLA